MMIDINKKDNTKEFNVMLKKLTFRFPIAEISATTGFSKGSVSEILKGNRAPSDAFLKKFAEVYNLKINSELIETYLNPKNPKQQNFINEPNSDYEKDTKISVLKQMMEMQDAIIEMQKKEIKRLESENEQLLSIPNQVKKNTA